MQLTVVSDSHGRILSLFSVPHPAGPAGATLAYVPKPGERVHVLDVPKGFEKKPLAELHSELHVTTHGAEVALVRRP
ncbi:MAG TPA: hypothetical protein VMF05_01975 [Stellaceae bacterium]|nr:hypothetical protein [Stellaceae bacterium]